MIDFAPRSAPPAVAVTTRLLVIGCGNTLFADDAIGPLVAERFADEAHPGVLALPVPELTPELAAPISAAEHVIFVDAALHGDEVRCVPVAPDALHGEHLDHALMPTALLELSRQALGRAPTAHVLLVPGEDFALGRPLSERARTGIEHALQLLRARA